MAFLAFLEGLLTLHSRGSVEVREGPLARGARTVQLDHHHSLHLLLLPAWRSPTPRDHSYAGLVPNLAPRTHLTSLTTEQPSCSLPLGSSGPPTHPPISRPASRAPILAWRRVGRSAAGGGQANNRRRVSSPTLGGRRRVRCIVCPLLLQELRWKVGFERASQPIPSLLRPWLGHSPKP